jgi:hypothetical protein
MIRSSDCPSASAAVKPNISSDPLFQRRMILAVGEHDRVAAAVTIVPASHSSVGVLHGFSRTNLRGFKTSRF